MELALFIIFAWFLFVIGKIFKDFAITSVSGIMILISGVLIFPPTTNTPLYTLAMVNICLGIYILFRSTIELIGLYLKDWKIKIGGKNAFKTDKNERKRS